MPSGALRTHGGTEPPQPPSHPVVHGTAVVQSTGRLVAYGIVTPGPCGRTRTGETKPWPGSRSWALYRAGLDPHVVILDGEVVAFHEGRPSFGRLQHRMHLARPAEIARVATTIPVCHLVFDLLDLDGDDLTRLRYTERRRLLAEVIEPGDGWLVPRHHIGGGADLLDAARGQQLEGIMAKRLDSPYLPGRRSPAWRTMCRRRAGVIDVVHGWRQRLRAGVDDTFGAGVCGVADVRLEREAGANGISAERTRVGPAPSRPWGPDRVGAGVR
jgi:hypothetical protein